MVALRRTERVDEAISATLAATGTPRDLRESLLAVRGEDRIDFSTVQTMQKFLHTDRIKGMRCTQNMRWLSGGRVHPRKTLYPITLLLWGGGVHS